MTTDQLLEELWCAVCDTCHWPFVYRDRDVMCAEKCEGCRVISLLKEIKRKYQGPDTLAIIQEFKREILGDFGCSEEDPS